MKALLCVFAPAGAIGAGALSQQLLVSLWPDVQGLSVLNVSLDSCFADAAIACLCLWVGRMIKRSAPARGTLIASFLFPLLWLVFLLVMMRPPNHMSGALRFAFLAAAVAPLVCIALAYALPSQTPWGGRAA